MPTYSVSFRLQRVTVEEASVSVPLTPDLVLDQPDGTGRLDVEKMVARALEMGQAPEVAWRREEQQVRPPPIQKPPDTDSRAA